MALDECDRAVRLRPNCPLTITLRGWARQHFASPESSGTGLTPSENPRTPPAPNDWRLVMDDFDQAILIDRTAPWPWAARALTWAYRGECQKAQSDFSEAIRLDPTDVYLLTFRGNLRLQSGHTIDAERDFEDAVQIDPACGPGWVGLAVAADRFKDPVRVIERCTRAIRLDSRNPMPFLLRRRAVAVQGNWLDALDDYGEALRGALSVHDRWAVLYEVGELALRFPAAGRRRQRLLLVTPESQSRGMDLLASAVRHAVAGEFPQVESLLNRSVASETIPLQFRIHTKRLRDLVRERLRNELRE
jgi:tetratricopeptide (TPR) repeat protein